MVIVILLLYDYSLFFEEAYQKELSQVIFQIHMTKISGGFFITMPINYELKDISLCFLRWLKSQTQLKTKFLFCFVLCFSNVHFVNFLAKYYTFWCGKSSKGNVFSLTLSSPERFFQTYFPKGVVATPLWIISTECHITLNLLPMYIYEPPLSIDTKISTNY